MEAQEFLRDYEVDTFSQLKPGPRRKRHAEVHKKAYPTKIYRPKTTATVGDLNRKLNKG